MRRDLELSMTEIGWNAGFVLRKSSPSGKFLALNLGRWIHSGDNSLALKRRRGHQDSRSKIRMDDLTRSLLKKSDDLPIGTVQYDPEIIQRHAEHLYSRAAAVVVGCTVIGIAIGASAGFGFGEAIARNLRWYFCVGGALFAGALGYVVGHSYALQLRLQAQLALCQMRIERNTRSASAV